MRKRLINLAFRMNGVYYRIKHEFNRLRDKPISKEELDDIRETEEHLSKRDIYCLTIFDKDYPDDLRRLSQPPFVLFYRGRLELLMAKNLLYLSGDYLSDRTEEALVRSEGALTRGSVLVTRSWLSFENRVIRTYQSSRTPVIFVSVAGISRFEWSLRAGIHFDPERDLVISESAYPVEFSELKMRNKATARLCAAISKALIIFSIETRSGLRYLIDRFLEVNKEVFCFSGRPRAVEEAEEQLIGWGASRIDLIDSL